MCVATLTQNFMTDDELVTAVLNNPESTPMERALALRLEALALRLDDYLEPGEPLDGNHP
jgi:hypothetical protein